MPEENNLIPAIGGPLGRSDLTVPAFGLGTGPLGDLFGRIPEPVAAETFAAAWAEGVRLFDTAAWYGRGLSEHRAGAFLRPRPRDSYVLTTKVGRTLFRPADPARFDRRPFVGGLNFEVKFDYSYDGIMRSYEQALQRLGVDTVDALAIHDLDTGFHGDAFDGHRATLLETGVRALEELKRAGDIRAIGMGFNLAPELEQFVGEIDLDYALVAHPYTLLDQGSLHTGMAACQARGTSVIIGAPFASGILVTGSGRNATYAYGAAPEAVQRKVQRIERVCAAHDVPLAAAALQFVLAHPSVRAVIPGATEPAHVKSNVASLRLDIPASFWTDLRTEGLVDPDSPLP